MKFYPNTIKTLRELIGEKYPNAEPYENTKDIPSHSLWMMEGIEKMGEGDSKKAARWIGWVFGSLESIGLINNTQSRDMVRVDVKNGNE